VMMTKRVSVERVISSSRSQKRCCDSGGGAKQHVRAWPTERSRDQVCTGWDRTSEQLKRGSGFDPSATLAVHCGNGFTAGFSPYQSTRLKR
jgi:hypothetical protein